ncbi:hypothetical protein EON65_41665 [archaeon]|nr:MAG: hypothetical protein EON65_41665 [archaeon]
MSRALLPANCLQYFGQLDSLMFSILWYYEAILSFLLLGRLLRLSPAPLRGPPFDSFGVLFFSSISHYRYCFIDWLLAFYTRQLARMYNASSLGKQHPLLIWNRRVLLRRLSSSPFKSSMHTQYCIDLVKKHDYEGYLAGLLIPKEYRRGYFALKAFNVEIATIKDQVPRSSQQAGRLRFNFWKDLLQQMDGQGNLAVHINQPVVVELHEVIQQHKLEVRFLERIVEAR